MSARFAALVVAIAAACSSGSPAPRHPVDRAAVSDAGALDGVPMPVAEPPPATTITDALLEREPLVPADPSKTLTRALELYAAGDYRAALVGFHTELTEELPSLDNRQRAQLFLAKTMSRLGYHIPAYAQLARIIEDGPSNPYGMAAATWLIWLVPKVWFAAIVVPHTLVDDPEVAPFVDELRYRLGVNALTRGELADATQLFEDIDPRSAFHAVASIELATTLWSIGKTASALAVLDKAAASGELGARIDMLRGSALMREGRYDDAIAAYERASTYQSILRRDATFAVSAARLARDGKLGELADGGMDWLVRIAYYDYCRRGVSADAFGQFRGVSDSIARELTAFATQFDDPAEQYDAIREVLAGGGTMSDRARFYVKMALSTGTPTQMFGFAAELEAEMALFFAHDDAWKATTVAAQIQRDIALNMSLAQSDSGRLAGELLEQVAHEIEQLTRDSEGVVVATLEEPGDGLTMLAQACQ